MYFMHTSFIKHFTFHIHNVLFIWASAKMRYTNIPAGHHLRNCAQLMVVVILMRAVWGHIQFGIKLEPLVAFQFGTLDKSENYMLCFFSSGRASENLLGPIA